MKGENYMSSVSKTFDKYYLIYASVNPPEPERFIVYCACSKGVTNVGRIYFYPDGATMPANTLGGDGIIYLYYEIKRFSDIYTILRYEKPLQIYVNSVSGHGEILTTDEPVGEQE
jgi:hypothetical protein